MTRKKKSLLSLFGAEGEDLNTAQEGSLKQPLDDCEGIAASQPELCSADAPSAMRKGASQHADLRMQNAALQRELDALHKTLSEVQKERENLKLQIEALHRTCEKDIAKIREPAETESLGAGSVRKYRTSGLPAHRIKRIPTKNIVFKGRKRS